MRSIALLALAMVTPGCISLGCTDVLPIPGVSVTMNVAGTLPPGDYTIEVHADGVVLSLPETLDASGGASQPSWKVSTMLADGRHLFVQGAVFATEGDATVGYEEGGGPTALAIDVSSATASIGHADFTPTYHETEPNGRGCGINVVSDAQMTITP